MTLEVQNTGGQQPDSSRRGLFATLLGVSTKVAERRFAIAAAMGGAAAKVKTNRRDMPKVAAGIGTAALAVSAGCRKDRGSEDEWQTGEDEWQIVEDEGQTPSNPDFYPGNPTNDPNFVKSIARNTMYPRGSVLDELEISKLIGDDRQIKNDALKTLEDLVAKKLFTMMETPNPTPADIAYLKIVANIEQTSSGITITLTYSLDGKNILEQKRVDSKNSSLGYISDTSSGRYWSRDVSGGYISHIHSNPGGEKYEVRYVNNGRNNHPYYANMILANGENVEHVDFEHLPEQN